MASSKASNSTLSSNRGVRLNSFDRIPTMNPPSKLRNGFSPNSMAWDSNGSIWANGNNSNTFVDGSADPEPCSGPALNSNKDTRYFRGKTGSGSLLSLSELDGWNYRSNFPWSSEAPGNSSASPQQQEQAISSIHLRNGDLTTGTTGLPFNDQDISPLLPVGQYGRFGAPDFSFHEPSRQSGSTTEQQNANSLTLGNFCHEPNRDDKRWKINAAGFRSNESGSPTQSSPHFLNSNNEFSPLRLGKLQHTGFPTQSGNNFDLPQTRPRSSRASNPPDLCYNSTSYALHRLSGSTNQSLSSRQDKSFQFDGKEDQLVTKFQRIDLKAEAMPKDITSRFHTRDLSQREVSALDTSREAGISRHKHQNGFEYVGLPNQQTASSGGAADVGYQFPTDYRQNIPFGERESSSPTASDHRRGLSSPFYSANGSTPPTGPVSVRSASGNGFPNQTSHGHIVTVDRESRGSRPFHLDEEYVLGNPSHARLPYSQPFGFDGYPGSMRLNPLAVPYSTPAYGGLTGSYQPRFPSRESDPSQIIRSPLLEEFRANHKTSKRYELKDIYNHVVEFSGDQHGSRFIQQKLETANSDEKDQIFAEIQPNSLQLMTDVFGNYVIQKLFEHGSQTQKKILANQMKNRVMNLSTQMYGCRVVQKALEHILTDQQASMVKELEAHVLKCVKDQNGNHVIQKAIERVPAEHIQFIINAFKGQVNRLAAHPYGCRVIQRMLERCEEPARQSILEELHAGVYQLITDQYGNYVIQHVIEKGHECDRTRVVATVISQLLTFSKHKFASNVVEKSIQCAEASQRAEILRILTTPNDKGESPLLGLMRDQYGNYVIQKSLGDVGFKAEERERLVEHCKPEFMKLKRFSSGKQVMALEKLIFDGDSEPNLSSSQSSTIPSTNTSTVEGPTTLTLPPVQILKTSLTAEPATAIASTP